jgi:DNA-binding protein WhiA
MLKGLFAGAGSVADPAKRYHFEIITTDMTLAVEVRRLMNSFTDIHASVIERTGKYIVYLKAAEQIKDMLGIIDAHLHLLAFEDARARHELRGRVNRFSNCDNANMDRQAAAGAAQIQTILTLESHLGSLYKLPPKLYEAAEIRKTYPEASIAELGALLNPPVSKSAAAARLKRLERYIEKIVNHK